MTWWERVRSWFAAPQPLQQEIVHYQTPPDAERQYRLHLRVEPDGRGLLIINAATVLHLNQTATEYAHLLIQGADEQEAVRTITRRYQVGPAQARADYRRLRDHILALATAVDLCPVTYLDMERVEPFSAESTAPYRVDIALTYRADKEGTLDPAARRRVEREYDTAEWREVLDRLWSVGVPHVCFTGGEPTLREDLVDLVRHAESLGMVTGLLSDGWRLADWSYLEGLLLAGLDHTQMTVLSHQAAVHDRLVGREGAWAAVDQGLRNAIAGDLYVVGHILVTPANATTIEDTVAYLAGLGVPAVALSRPRTPSSEEERHFLEEAMNAAQEVVHQHTLTLVWDLAAPYSQLNPVEEETDLLPDQVTRQHLYIEPDGDVLPAQGHNLVLGNILRDPWEGIWGNPARHRPVDCTVWHEQEGGWR